MATTVKPIEAKTIHQIQSGQVIVDLCSVVKELVENGLDAGSTALEVRFKNNGLDEIEVADNGSGIARANYENVALKHYTSKLTAYDDLEKLSTFGFRGEALSSLCALSSFTITTAQADEVPKGHRLEFEISGKLKSTSLVACQKGTTASVSKLFEKLPVRRKELIKNIKREYNRVLGLLHAYACISTNVKFVVKNTMPKGKTVTVFATQANGTTRDNLANVYGAKALSALVALDLSLDFEPDSAHLKQNIERTAKVLVKGHISKPVFGEGRQTPDRQMFFVNGRPCGLPQIAKAINEVYRSFNVSQSPFVFADFQMDTNAYDVNVSPDKRSIFLHNAASMIETLKLELTTMFNRQEQTVPQVTLQTSKVPSYQSMTLRKAELMDSSDSSDRIAREKMIDRDSALSQEEEVDSSLESIQPGRPSEDSFQNSTSFGQHVKDKRSLHHTPRTWKEDRTSVAKVQERADTRTESTRELGEHNARRESVASDISDTLEHEDKTNVHLAKVAERDLSGRSDMTNDTDTKEDDGQESHAAQSMMRETQRGVVPSAFDRIRPRRMQPELATITIGDKTITRMIGPQTHRNDTANGEPQDRTSSFKVTPRQRSLARQFLRQIDQFSAPGTQERIELERIEDQDDDAEQPETNDYTNYALRPTEDLEGPGSHSEEEDNEIDADEQDGGSNLTGTNEKQSVWSDAEYVDENEQKNREQARVANLIKAAEESRFKPSRNIPHRANQALRGGRGKDSTVNLEIVIHGSLETFEEYGATQRQSAQALWDTPTSILNNDADRGADAEERLSLTVSKSDFSKMQIVGQFNLGFIIAVRPQKTLASAELNAHSSCDELFIIDQHASDEKYNFERLQAETVVGNQRMVNPVTLDLTAVEEEILIDGTRALEKNGFIVEIDTSGEKQVGQRCQLVGLPISKEVVFNTRDLDELIHLLQESPMLSDSHSVPRPVKVRKMFAMRACRSSIMIGKTLSKRQMSTTLRHMGSIDKPWNCPHGRPTMRHLASLDALDRMTWREGDGLDAALDSMGSPASRPAAAEIWGSYAATA